MAISLSGFRQAGAKQTIAKKLAKQYNEQQRKAQKRKGWSSLLGGVGGKLLGTAAVGALGLTGFGAPLAMALGSMMGKKGAHELTSGMGADTGKISGGDIYGYGKEESKTLKGMLESQMAVDPTKERGGFGKELLSAYVSAGMAGKLPSLKEKGLKGMFSKESFIEEGKGLLGGGKEGFKTWGKELFGKATEEVYSPLHDVTEGEDYQGLFFETDVAGAELPPLEGMATRKAKPTNYLDAISKVESTPAVEFPSQESIVDFSETLEPVAQSVSETSPENLLSFYSSQNLAPDALRSKIEGNPKLMKFIEENPDYAQMYGFKFGGQVPKYYGGGSVSGSPTISDYFATQGKTLGGSNKQSLAQTLGR